MENGSNGKSNGGATTVSVSAIEMWIIRIVGMILVSVLGWIGVQFQTALLHIAEIRKELEITRPADVLDAVRELERVALTKDEVREIVVDKAQWPAERDDWFEWRGRVEHRLNGLEQQ